MYQSLQDLSQTFVSGRAPPAMNGGLFSGD